MMAESFETWNRRRGPLTTVGQSLCDAGGPEPSMWRAEDATHVHRRPVAGTAARTNGLLLYVVRDPCI